MNEPTDARRMRALAQMKEDEPEYTRTVLRDSGFGELAEEWLDAAQEFSRVAQHADHDDSADDSDLRSHVVRAYARRCVTWARISQLRDQARTSMEQSP